MFGAAGAAPEEAVYFLSQYRFEFAVCLIGMFPVKNIFVKFFESHKENKAVAVLGEFLPKIFALFVFAFSYMKLVSGSFNPFIYFQF